MKRQIVGALVVTAGTPIRPSAFSSPNVWTAWKTEVIERHAYTSGFSDINGNCLLLRLLSGLVFWKRTGYSISSQSIESSLTSPSRKKNLSGLLSSRTNATAQFCYSRNKNAPITLSLSLPVSLFLFLSPPIPSPFHFSSLVSPPPFLLRERKKHDAPKHPKYMASSFIFEFMMTNFTSCWAHLTKNPNAYRESVFERRKGIRNFSRHSKNIPNKW